MIDIVGTGFGRTGTVSLYLAFKQLGCGPVFHNEEIPKNPGIAKRIHDVALGGTETWKDLLDGYRACLDFPCCGFWKDILREAPEARVIHTTRDPDDWYDSIHGTIFNILRKPLPDAPAEREHWEMSIEVILKQTFDMRLDDRVYCTDIFRAREADVLATVPRNKLLVFDVRQGWEPLCAFLDVPVPDEDFPRTNSKAEFRLGWGLE